MRGAGRGAMSGALGGRPCDGRVTVGVLTAGVVVAGVVTGGTVTVGSVTVGSVIGGGGSGGRAAADPDQPAASTTTIKATCTTGRRRTGLIQSTCAFWMPGSGQTCALPRLNGGGEIRTHGPREGPTVFKTAPFDRSGTPPDGHRSPPTGPSDSLLLSQLGSILSGAPNCLSTSGTSPWKFSRTASAQRSVTAVPFSVCTCSIEPFRR